MRVLKLFVWVLLLFGGLSGAQAEQEPGQQDFHPTMESSIVGPIFRGGTFLYKGILKHVRDNLYFNTKNGCFYRKLGGVYYREHNGYLYTAHADSRFFYKAARNKGTKGDDIRMTQTVVDDIINSGTKYWDTVERQPVKILKESGAVVFDEENRRIVVTVLVPQHAASAIANKRFVLRNW